MLSQDSHKAPSNSHVNGLLRPEAEGPAQTLSRPSWARWVPRATPQATALGRGQERSHLHTVAGWTARSDRPAPPGRRAAWAALLWAPWASVSMLLASAYTIPRGPKPPTPTPHGRPLTLRREPGPQQGRPAVLKIPGRGAGSGTSAGEDGDAGEEGPSGSATRVRRPGAGPDPWPQPLPGPSPTHRVQLSGTGLRKHAGRGFGYKTVNTSL